MSGCACGHEHLPGRCTGHSQRTGKPCTNYPIAGSNVCRMHGGAASQVKAAAARRVQAAEAREAVLELGLTAGVGRIDPRDALELELWRTHVSVQLYEALIADLELGEGGIYGPLYHADGGRTGRALPHVLVTMRDEERDRLARVAVAAAKAGVEERRQQLAERHATLIADVFRAVFSDPELGLPAKQREAAMGIAGRHLRALPSAA